MSKKDNQRIELEKELEPLEQYGRPFGELSAKQEADYSYAIGRFFLAFSYLETSLDHMIITAISDCADEQGYRIIQYLKFRDKINLAKGEYQRMIYFVGKAQKKKSLTARLNLINQKLIEISEFRNKVAHANWESLSATGFVRVKIQDEQNGEGIGFVRVKMTPQVINKFSRLAIKIADGIDEISDPSPLAFA